MKNCFELNDEFIKINTQQVIFEHKKNKKRKVTVGWLCFIFVVFPSGKVGYRMELDGEDLGTIYFNDKEGNFQLVNW